MHLWPILKANKLVIGPNSAFIHGLNITNPNTSIIQRLIREIYHTENGTVTKDLSQYTFSFIIFQLAYSGYSSNPSSLLILEPGDATGTLMGQNANMMNLKVKLSTDRILEYSYRNSYIGSSSDNIVLVYGVS